jgi:hypothetical protein
MAIVVDGGVENRSEGREVEMGISRQCTSSSGEGIEDALKQVRPDLL